MPLKNITDCTEAERGHKAASLTLLAQLGVNVPDAWMWLQPRRSEDLQEAMKSAASIVILRASEPLDCDPQGVSGAYPSQVFSLSKISESVLDPWIEAAHPVIVQHYVIATFGGAAHIRMIEDNMLMVHLSWSLDVSSVMNGSDSGMEVWLGDLPSFEGHEAPVFIARTAYIPEFLECSDFVSKFLSQIRPVAQALGTLVEVEWIVDDAGSLVFLQLIRLTDTDDKSKAPWVHADASQYGIEK